MTHLIRINPGPGYCSPSICFYSHLINGITDFEAAVQGSKYWIMFPPSSQVPGVFVSEDSSEVTSPLSIAEWLLEFHADARKLPGCIEGVCKAGEILHVPSGWWHLVVNCA